MSLLAWMKRTAIALALVPAPGLALAQAPDSFDFGPLLGYETMSCGAGYSYDPSVRDCVELGLLEQCPPNSSSFPQLETCVCDAGFQGDPFEGGCMPIAEATPVGVDMVPGSGQGPALPMFLFAILAGVVVLLIWARRGARS